MVAAQVGTLGVSRTFNTQLKCCVNTLSSKFLVSLFQILSRLLFLDVHDVIEKVSDQLIQQKKMFLPPQKQAWFNCFLIWRHIWETNYQFTPGMSLYGWDDAGMIPLFLLSWFYISLLRFLPSPVNWQLDEITNQSKLLVLNRI